MVSSKRRAFPLSLPLALGLISTLQVAGGGCRARPADVTALRLVTTWTDVDVDQLEFSITVDGGAPLAGPTRRPAEPRRLASGEDVVVYFGDERGGTNVTCDVRAFFAGKVVATASGRAHLVARAEAMTKLPLIALPGSKTEAAPCHDDGECASGVCADGVCCRTSCAGACLACNVAGKQGTCSPVPEGGKHPLCADQGAASCGFDGTCDGHSACRKYPLGARCASGRCDGSSITAAAACDGDGHCQMGPVITCAPFSCDPSGDSPRCFATCTTSEQCVRGRSCVAGSCGTKLDGARCEGAAECASGFCVDGVCCDSSCEGACVSCAQVGSLGMCRPVADGVKDPRAICTDAGPASCGPTGACNGSGGCARYPTGTVCRGGSCSGTVLHSAWRCDGAGQCLAGSDLTCAPYSCTGGACTSACQSNADCAPGIVCDTALRSCGKKGLGQPCGGSPECNSGFCIDAVCCDTSCQGPCRSCALGQTPGKCTNTPPGALDPRRACKDLGKSKCDTDGTCDGRGGCRKYPAGTVCGPQTCNGTTSTRTLAPTCDGKGACRAGQMVSCGAYRCNGAVCFSACSSDAECVAPNTCNGGACSERGMGAPCSATMPCVAPLTCIGNTCQLKMTGVTCAVDGECTTGHCSDGVCCDDGPCPLCASCKVAGFVGFCHALPAGSPDTRCTVDPPTSCHQDGTCDGGGACRLYSAGTVCEVAGCAGQIRNNPKTCDGTGACQDNGTTDCAPFVCDPMTRNCFVSCTDDAQCCCKKCGGDNSCN
jgi:hypothetical protein